MLFNLRCRIQFFKVLNALGVNHIFSKTDFWNIFKIFPKLKRRVLLDIFVLCRSLTRL